MEINKVRKVGFSSGKGRRADKLKITLRVSPQNVELWLLTTWGRNVYSQSLKGGWWLYPGYHGELKVLPVVSGKDPGDWLIELRWGVPFFQLHDIKYQKLLLRFNAPPVVHKSLPQCWANKVKLLITSCISSSWFWANDAKGLVT